MQRFGQRLFGRKSGRFGRGGFPRKLRHLGLPIPFHARRTGQVIQIKGPECSEALSVDTCAAQWFRRARNRDVSTKPLAGPFARSRAPLNHSLTPELVEKSMIVS